MGTVDASREELMEEFLALIPRDKVGEAQYQELVQYAEDMFLKVRHDHILTTPLLEVLHVNIHSDSAIFNDKEKPCEVYGTVQVLFGEGIVFDLYNHGQNDPEIVHIGDIISLIIPKGCAIFPSAKVRMEIDLKDKARNNVQIAKGSLIWEFQTQMDFERVKTEMVHGDYGFAAVHYITFQHAIIANLDVMLVETRDGEHSHSGGSDIYGSIIAHYGTTYSSKLFEKRPSQAVTVKCGASIELSRYVVAVPAHSPLVVKAELYTADSQQIVCKEVIKLEFSHYGYSYIEDLAENGSIQVEVMWENAYMLPPPQSAPTDICEADDMIDHLDIMPYGGFDQQAKLPFFSVIRNSPSSWRRALSIQPMPFPLKEVFSVFVGTFKDSTSCISEAGSSIYGSIVVAGEFMMFERKQDSPLRLLPDQTIPITHPYDSFMGNGFDAHVELYGVDGGTLSRGSLEWSGRYTEFPGWKDMKNKCQLSWYDRQLCSLIRGDKGYATVHYLIISRGLQATVNVSFFAKSSSDVVADVWGSLVGRYSNQRYPTHYEKEYFRSKLFWKNEKEATTVSPGGQIPLSQPVVAVPVNSALMVDVDLHFRLHGSDKYTKMDVMSGVCLDFKSNTDYTEHPLVIEGHYCDVHVSLEWNGAL